MIKYFFKKFSDKNKLGDARKRAMETYEKMLSENKININRGLEDDLKSKERGPDLKDYKSQETRKRVEDLVSNFEYVKIEKPKLENVISKARIRGDTLYYTMSDYNKLSYQSDRDWMTIYELMVDRTFEKFKNALKLLLLGLLTYNTYKWLLRGDQTEKLTKSRVIKYTLFYGFVIGLFIIDRSFNKGFVTRIQLRKQGLDKLRIYLQTGGSLEVDVKSLFSISSKRKSHHEIMLYNGGKVLQLFASKNAKYDQELLINLCHRDIAKVKFTNLNF
jgi:hypothetical protein